MTNSITDRSAEGEQECARCVALQGEIGALKDKLAEMAEYAYHDELTALANRRLYVESLESRIARCQRYGDTCAVLFLDVDNLKMVNDGHGHAAGDALLKCLANILKSHTRTSDVVARIGGDEFGLLLDNLDADQVVSKIDFFVDQFSQADCTYAGKPIPFGATIGYCFIGPRDTVDGLMSRADAAMYRGKGKPK